MVELKASEIAEILAVARAIIAETRRLITARTASGFKVYFKEDQSEVTDVDRETEALIHASIADKFPTHGILGEEGAFANKGSDFLWLIDPIDGTQNFSHGIPTFGTILGVKYRGTPIVGITDHPALDLCYSAALQHGAYCNDQRLKVADLPTDLLPQDELIMVSTPANFARTGDLPVLNQLIARHANIRIYGDCYTQTSAISGRSGAAISMNVKPWDLAAAQILTEEAGGKFIPIRRNENHPSGHYVGAIMGKPRVVNYLADLLQIS